MLNQRHHAREGPTRDVGTDVLTAPIRLFNGYRLLAIRCSLVCRLTYNDDVAAGQLAVFQGASDEHI
jgi:hypothetical protein